MCMCVCVCMCVCNIGKKVLKLQFSDNKDIGLIFIYEITSSCISTSSFAVLDIIFKALCQTIWMWLNRSHLVLGLVFYSNFRYKFVSRILYIFCVCVCEFTNHFFFHYLGTAIFGSFLQRSHHRTPLTCFTFVLHIRHAT